MADSDSPINIQNRLYLLLESWFRVDHDKLTELTARVGEYRESQEARLEKLNELREQVTTDRNLYVREDVFNARINQISQQLGEVRDWQSRMMGMGLVLALGATIVGALIGHSIWR